MYKVSNEYKQTIYSGQAVNQLKIIFGGNELEDIDEHCEKLTIKSRIISETSKSFNLNNFISKEAELILHNVDLEDIIDKVEISIGTLINNQYEYVPIGIFNIQDTPTTDKDKVTIKLRDNAVMFDFNYDAKPIIDSFNGKAPKYYILLDICEKANVILDCDGFDGWDDLVGIYDNTITARQYISYIAEQAGLIATINREGHLEFININSETTTSEAAYENTTVNALDEYAGIRIYGNSYQKQNNGINLFDYKFVDNTTGGVRAIVSDDAILTLDGNTTSGHQLALANSITYEANTNYTMYYEIVDGSFTPYNSAVNWAVLFFPTSSTQLNLQTGRTKGAITFKPTQNTTFSPYAWFGYNAQTVSGVDAVFKNLKLKIMIVKGAYNVNTIPPYEEHQIGVSPSPTNEVPIENVKGFDNLLNLEYCDLINSNATVEYIDESNIRLSGTYAEGRTWISNQYELNDMLKGQYGLYFESPSMENTKRCAIVFSIYRKSDNTRVFYKDTFSWSTFGRVENVFTIPKGYENSELYYQTLGFYIVCNAGEYTPNSRIFVDFKNVMLYKYNNKHLNTYYPYGSYLTIQSIGDNMFDKSSLSEYIGNDGSKQTMLQLNNNGFRAIANATGNYKRVIYYVDNPQGKNYSVKCKAKTSGSFTPLVDFYYWSGNFQQGTFGYQSASPISQCTTTSLGNNEYEIQGTVNVPNTLPNGMVGICIYFYVNSTNNVLIGDYTDYYDVMITNTSTPQDYIPFSKSNWELRVGNAAQLCGIGDVKDEYYQGTITKRIGAVTLYGDEDEVWEVSGTSVQSGDKAYVFKLKESGITYFKSNTHVLCTHFKDNLDNWFTDLSSGRIAFISNNFYIRIPSSIANNVTELRTWLSDNPVTVYYQLDTNHNYYYYHNPFKTLNGTNNLTINDKNAKFEIDYKVEKTPYEIPLDIIPSYQLGDKYKISGVVYESGIIKYSYPNDIIKDNEILYIDASNPYIFNQQNVENIYNHTNGFEIESLKIDKMLGNPALEPYDLIKFVDDDDIEHISLANNTLIYNGNIGQEFNTELTKQSISSNTTKNTQQTFQKYAKTEIDNLSSEIKLISGETTTIKTQIDENTASINNNYNEIISKFDDYALNDDIITIQNQVETIQGSTYTRTEIQQIASGTYNDQSGNPINITYIETTAGTFSKDGLKIEKTDAPTDSLLNEKGLLIEDTKTNEDLLFAGYVDKDNEKYLPYEGQTIVGTNNIVVKHYAIFGNHSRMEDYNDNGVEKTGMFPIGE